MYNIKYYKVSIKFKEKILLNNIDLSCLEDDLIQAKEEFNAYNKNQIALLKPHSRRINILVESFGDFRLNSISQFLDILINEMNWKQYSVQDSNSFELVFANEITKEDCYNYVSGTSWNNNECIDKMTITKWIRMDDHEKDTNINFRMKGFPNRPNRMNNRKLIESLEKKIDGLIAKEDLKKELIGWIELNSKLNESEESKALENKIPYNYIFTASPGSGISHALKLMSEVYFNLNIIARDEYREINLGQKNYKPFIFGRNDYGIVNGIIIDDYSSVDTLDGQEYNMVDTVYVFIIDPKNDDYDKIVEKVESIYVCKNIKLEDLNGKELLRVLEFNLENYGFHLSNKSRKGFEKFISSNELAKINAKTMQVFSSKIIMSEIGNLESLKLDEKYTDEKYTIDDIGFNLLKINGENEENRDSKDISGIEELSNLIGLGGIKTQVNDIINQIVINKRKEEEGLIDRNETGTMHMMFYGNPGTGKTTVARIMGKIFKEAGILEKGEFFEVGREDLVGEYVGHTAIDTSRVLNKALGSVLFIDEAYSLNSGSKYDYGKEALNTIVRYMENHRDKIVIIFAGYKNEMEEFFSMNPGLRSRVPFKVEFKDYSKKEMLDIFKLFCKDNCYFDKDVEFELLKLFEKSKDYYDDDFSNGRFVRNVYEKIMMKQSSRLAAKNKLDRDSLREITIEDVLGIYEDDEYSRIIEFEKNQGIPFGFKVNG